MIDSPAYFPVYRVFDPVIIESVDIRIFIEQSQNIDEAVFCLSENFPDLVAETDVILFRLRAGNVDLFRGNIEISEPQKESVFFAVNNFFDTGEKIFLDVKVGVFD